jgi:hypothetical protein
MLCGEHYRAGGREGVANKNLTGVRVEIVSVGRCRGSYGEGVL